LQPHGSLPSNFSSTAGAVSRNTTATARRRKVTAGEILSSNSFHAVPIDRSPLFRLQGFASNHLKPLRIAAKLERISRCSIRTVGVQKNRQNSDDFHMYQ
jgi:hypothetical protein